MERASNYYWKPDKTDDIIQYVKSCDKCQKGNDKHDVC